MNTRAITARRKKVSAALSSSVKLEGRNRLAEKHFPLVKSCAKRLWQMFGSKGAAFGEDDLFSAGLVGLLEAASYFNPGRGTSFLTFSASRIRGAMLDELRGQDFFKRAGRKKIRIVQHLLCSGESLCEEKVAAAMDQSIKQARSALYLSRFLQPFNFSGLARPESAEETDPLHLLIDKRAEDPFCVAEREDLHERVRALLGTAFCSRDQTIALLYYGDGLREKAIGQILGVSESAVSLRLRHIKRRLKFLMTREKR